MEDVTDYSNWGVGFGRRWNALKLFYVIKSFGRAGIQEHLEGKIKLAEYFTSLIQKSDIFK